MRVASVVCVALGLGVAGAAGAAQQSAADPGSQADESPPALSEVVVTAERRTTNLQQTPIAASVLTGSDLLSKGIVTVDQLQTVMPSVSIQNFGQGNDFNIRGIGKGEHNTQTTTGVITYRDGVATFPGYFQDEPIYDISSLQVLRGPQGTFAGQNSTGGAVFITEADPDFSGVDGYVMGQYGNYDDTMLQGAVNLPVSGTVASRVAFYDEYRNSFYDISGPFTGGNGTLKESGLRASLLWTPSQSLRVLWKNDYAYIDSGGYPADPATAKNDLFHITANGPQLAIDQLGRSVLHVDYKFAGGVELKSISGIQWGRTAYNADLDGTASGILTFKDAVDEELYSQEFDLISPERGRLTWVAGVYYQANNYLFPLGRFDIGLPPGVFDYVLDGTNKTNTAAVFGQVTFNLSSSVQLQVGARSSYNDSVNRVRITYPEYGVLIPDHQSEHDDRTTGKVSLNWTLDPDNFLYGFIATGYKPGGLNVPSGAALPPAFRSEYVTDYEIGWKATAFGGHLRTQLGGYYNDFRNFQVTIDDPTEPTITLEVNNPSPTRLYGVEASAQGVFGNFALDVGGAWAHSSLGTFYAQDPRFPGAAACEPFAGPASPGCVNLSGHPQTYAPALTLNLGGRYTWHLGSLGALTARANYSHVGSQWATLFDNAALGDYLGARNLLSAQLALQHGDWTFTGYGTNLTDEHYVSAMQSQLRFAGAPRQFGLRVLRMF